MGFLDHLAAMALGAKPATAARVSLPPRFAGLPPEAGGIEQVFGHVEDSELPTNVAQGQPPSVGGAIGVASHQVSQVLQPEREGRPSPPAQSLAPRMAAPEWQARSASHDQGRPLLSLPPLEARREMRRDRTIPPPDVHEPAAPAQSVPTSRSQPVQPRAPLEAPPLRSVTRALPLSDAAVAGRASPVRDEPPVIQVTIDRLDVRAPAPSANAAERRRPRPQPTVSLSDYLRDGARGGRG